MRCTRCEDQVEKGHRHKYRGGVYCDKCIEIVSPEAKQRAKARARGRMPDTQTTKDLEDYLGAKGL